MVFYLFCWHTSGVKSRNHLRNIDVLTVHVRNVDGRVEY